MKTIKTKKNNFIIDTVSDLNIQNALLKNDDFVKLKNTNSDDDMQLYLKLDKELIST